MHLTFLCILQKMYGVGGESPGFEYNEQLNLFMNARRKMHQILPAN
jgi:hypothetical protein